MDAINDRITASMADFGLEGWMIEVFLTVVTPWPRRS